MVNSTFTKSSIVSLLILFGLIFKCFLKFLLQDYNLWFKGYPCYNASYKLQLQFCMTLLYGYSLPSSNFPQCNGVNIHCL